MYEQYKIYSDVYSRDTLEITVKFRDGRVYVLTFASPDFIAKELKKSKHKYLAIPALIPIDVVSIEKVKEVIGFIYQSGYFDHLKPRQDGE